METSAGKKRSSVWLPRAAWLLFFFLAVAMPLSLARWLMESSHQKAVILAKSRGKIPKASAGNGVAVSSAQKESNASCAIPAAKLPLIGVYVGDDSEAREKLEKQIDEVFNLMRSLEGASGIDCKVDGVLSFRAVLAKMGVPVPETMTDADAAAEFLRLSQRYSALLSQWREAVGKDSWDFSGLESKDTYTTGFKIFRMAATLQRLLGVVTEARLQIGDADGAWSELRTMNSSTVRNGEMRLFSPEIFTLRPQMMETAQAGMRLGVWTDSQLTEISTMLGEANALASVQRQLQGEKLWITDFLTRFRENKSEIQGDFSGSKSSIDQIINWIGITTATDQQMADNLAVIEYKMDQPFTRFDPDTGFYLGESPDDEIQLPRSKPSDLSFDKFYYMYSEMYGGRHDWVPEAIIRSQSNIDQTRIAAALEMQRRVTGQYPETLDTLGGSIPRDIATGQPYFYQRNADGGYTLWGTGIDGKSDGGDQHTDVIWTQKPGKAK